MQLLLPTDGDLDLADGDTQLDGADSEPDLPPADGDLTEHEAIESDGPNDGDTSLSDGDGSDNDTERADENGGDSDTDDTADRETDGDSDVERIELELDLPSECTAGELACSGSWLIRCSDNNRWSIEMDCTTMPGMLADATGYCEGGVCKSTAGSGSLCLDGAIRCKDAAHSEQCIRDESGSYSWVEQLTCTAAQYCLSGLCFERECTPGSKRCIGTTSQLCLEDGQSWLPYTDCLTAGKKCVSGECVLMEDPTECTGGFLGFRCISDTQSQYCDQNSRHWANFKTCGAAEKCHEGQCRPVCPWYDRSCPEGYWCQDDEGVCRLRPGYCQFDTDCPGTQGDCIVEPGKSIGTCDQHDDYCNKDNDCEGCTHCDLKTYKCVAYVGDGTCSSSIDCPSPAQEACIYPRDTCSTGICVKSCLSGGQNCKSLGQICDGAPTSRTYNTCVDPTVCIPCADDDDCGSFGRCGWREDARYRVNSGCCEWASWSHHALCHEDCTDGKTCFPNADACGLTSCQSGQCVQPDGSCGLCTCTNTSPYCVPVEGDNTGQGTCCPGYFCGNNNLCQVRTCGNMTCMKADGSCGACDSCTNPSFCALGSPPCCAGYTCNIPQGAGQGTCQPFGCYGKACTPLVSDCCFENQHCILANEYDRTGICI